MISILIIFVVLVQIDVSKLIDRVIVIQKTCRQLEFVTFSSYIDFTGFYEAYRINNV